MSAATFDNLERLAREQVARLREEKASLEARLAVVDQQLAKLVGFERVAGHPEYIASGSALEPDAALVEIEHPPLSVRCANCCTNANMATLADVAKRTSYELLRMRDFGKKSLQELRGQLARAGLRLADEQATPEREL